MIRHIVFWKLKDGGPLGSKEKNAQEMKRRLTALVGVVPGLISAEAGIALDMSGEYDVALCTCHSDREALEVYQNHPAHLEVKKFVHESVCARACVDFEI